MPVIYSFSIDYSKDLDLIKMIEQSNNKSALIRRGLRKVALEKAVKEYIRKLEKLVRTGFDAADLPPPNLHAIWKQCLLNNSTQEEEE